MSDILGGEGQLEDIGDPALDVLFEEGEHGEVEPGPLRIETLGRKHVWLSRQNRPKAVQRRDSTNSPVKEETWASLAWPKTE